MKSMLALIAGVTLVVAPVSAPMASAHTSLLAASPKIGSTVSSIPEIVDLTFDDDLMKLSSVGAKANSIIVTDPSGKKISVQESLVAGPSIKVKLKKISKHGTYTVTYRVVASDGHVLKSKYTFKIPKSLIGYK